MRARQLLHRSLPATTGDREATPGARALRRAGYVVPLGPGLPAGSALLQRTLARLQHELRRALTDLGAEEVALPAAGGDALLNLLGHLGWLAVPAPAPAFALGAGYRETAPEPRGLFDAHLYSRLDVLMPTGDEQTLRTLEQRLLSLLAGAGLPQVLAEEAPAEPGAPDPTGGRVLVLRAQGEEGDGAFAGAPLGRLLLRPLDETGARAVVLAELDLFAVIGAVAERHVDARGLRWPVPLSPFDVAVVPAAEQAAGAAEAASKVAAALSRAGFAVLLDDRASSPAEKRADAELWGLPLRVLCGPSATVQVVLEERRDGTTPRRVSTAELPAEVARSLGRPAPEPSSRTLRRATF